MLGPAGKLHVLASLQDELAGRMIGQHLVHRVLQRMLRRVSAAPMTRTDWPVICFAEEGFSYCISIRAVGGKDLHQAYAFKPLIWKAPQQCHSLAAANELHEG